MTRQWAQRPRWSINEGILGYVQTSPTGSNQRLYQYIYGGDTVFCLTANPADVDSYLPIYTEAQERSELPLQPGHLIPERLPERRLHLQRAGGRDHGAVLRVQRQPRGRPQSRGLPHYLQRIRDHLRSKGDTPQYENRYNQYDALGKLQDTHVVIRGTAGDVVNRVDVAYHDEGGATGLGYDAAGNLLGNRQVSDGDQGKATTTQYDYQSLNGSYQQTRASTWRGVVNGTKPPDAATKTWRDANGFVSNIEQTTGAADERFNRAFVNDAQGNAVYVNQGAGHTGRVQNQPGGYLGGWVGDSVNPGHVQRQLVANGEVLARYGDAPNSEIPPNPGDIPKYVDTAEFRLNAAPLKLKGANLDAIAYTVVGGETLKDIARNVLGDAKLWWRIAEANGLAVSGDGKLAAGQTLSVPKLALNANNVDTFQPYDPSRVTGSLDPNLPAPAGQGGGGCGGLGKIIMTVVTVVVAAYTGGIGGAMLGNLSGQVVGNVLGVQDGINWKSVALSGVSAGITAGLEGIPFFQGADWSSIALRAGTANLLTQGVGVATGLQKSFDWRGVAASAAGAVVGSAAGAALRACSKSFEQ